MRSHKLDRFLAPLELPAPEHATQTAKEVWPCHWWVVKGWMEVEVVRPVARGSQCELERVTPPFSTLELLSRLKQTTKVITFKTSKNIDAP